MGICLLLGLMILLLLLTLVYHRLAMEWLGTHGHMLLDRLLLLLLLQHWLTIEGWLWHLRTVRLRGLYLLTWRIANLLLRLLWVKALIRM